MKEDVSVRVRLEVKDSNGCVLKTSSFSAPEFKEFYLSNPYLTGEESKIEPTGKPRRRKPLAIIDKDGNSLDFNFGDEATKAVTDMSGKMLAGKPIYVTLAQRKEEVRQAQLNAAHAARTGMTRGPMGMSPMMFMPGMMGGARPMMMQPGMQPGMQQGAKYCYGMNQSSKEKQGIDHNIAYRNALKANKAAVVKHSTLKLSSGEWPALGK